MVHGCPRIPLLNQQELNTLPSLGRQRPSYQCPLMTRLPVTQSLHAHSDGQACACDAILINTPRKFGASDALTAPRWWSERLVSQGECLEQRGWNGGVISYGHGSPVLRGGNGMV
ncbi:hypothetical protein CEXT_158171 [Caerostris extrusa]|uniref:Uncharacterized protein n=1 Tax=Caerostris extrusa TaxID=172846 RepID=A0AAV4XDA0_CAEEX|nr:hypothetical protein CEXT_158171 [Caerostris extrusa]